jgi:hypothetical protein
LHRRAQVESQSPVSCAIAVSSDNRSQEVGKQGNRSSQGKIIRPATSSAT